MSLFDRFRAPLSQPTKQSTAEYLCRLMEEQNGLLRELIYLNSGRHAATLKPGNLTTPGRVRTDKDVAVVTRPAMLEMEREQRRASLTLGNGPASGSAPTPGNGADRPKPPAETSPSPSRP